jgi:hypothetical protein
MDFTLPEDLVGLLAKTDEFIEREIRPLERENDNIRFSITGARTPGPAGTAAACPARNGRRCSPKHGAAPTTQAFTVTPSLWSTAVWTAPTWEWRSSGSI